MTNYISLELCREYLFPLIRQNMERKYDPAPMYEYEEENLKELDGILQRIWLNYYPDFFDKAAYLYVSVIDGYYFFNGNKRLALSLLMTFVYINKRKIISGELVDYIKKIKELPLKGQCN